MLSLDASNVEAIASLAANHFYGGLTHTRARRSVRRSTIVYSVLTTKRYIVSANRYRNEKKLPTLILSRFFQTFPPPQKVSEALLGIHVQRRLPSPRCSRCGVPSPILRSKKEGWPDARIHKIPFPPSNPVPTLGAHFTHWRGFRK